ncbi:MAG: hypothetical protein Q4F03_10255 [Eubacteriales bacterium]|nr:hypothetical protein [Eubacteriales bacterium]
MNLEVAEMAEAAHKAKYRAFVFGMLVPLKLPRRYVTSASN